MLFSGKSDIGLKRTSNQDSFDITKLPGGCLLATVCDGMGGASGGNIASEIACRVYTDYVCSHFEPESTDVSILLTEAIAEANKTVYERAKNDESLSGMGTTLVSVLIRPDGNATAVNIGDSKLFSVYSDKMKQITHDHSYVQYLVDMGQITVKEARTASIRNIIIRSVGNEEKANPDLFDASMSDDVTFLLCSDGLTGCTSYEKITEIINENRENLDTAVDKLIEYANSLGGNDNITVILVRM